MFFTRSSSFEGRGLKLRLAAAYLVCGAAGAKWRERCVYVGRPECPSFCTQLSTHYSVGLHGRARRLWLVSSNISCIFLDHATLQYYIAVSATGKHAVVNGCNEQVAGEAAKGQEIGSSACRRRLACFHQERGGLKSRSCHLGTETLRGLMGV